MSSPAGPDQGPPWRRIIVDVPGLEFEARPPRAARSARADSECDGWSTEGITVRSASLRGDRHRYYGEPRQDAVCSAAHEPTGAVAFAVADGVSGAQAPETGALAACRAAVSAIMDQFDHGAACLLDGPAVARQAAQELLRRAAAMLGTPAPPDPGQAGKLLATTLVAGAAWPSRGGLRVHLLRIGDSSAWILDPARGYYSPIFGSPAEGEPAVVTVEVTALPEVPAVLPQATAAVGAGQVLLIGTDGFGLPLGDGDGQIGALFARHLAAPPSPLWLAHVLDFSRETFDDDRTLLALWPVQGQATGQGRGPGPAGGGTP